MTGHVHPPIAARFANWAHGLGLAEIPREVVRQARRTLLDTIGVICAGARHDITSMARHAFIAAGQGPCSVAGGGSTTAAGAALINGTAAHAYDFDDASHTGIMHGSAVIVPAVLAAMQDNDATDAQVLEAIVAGSEISYVLGDAITHGHYLRGWWSTSTLSVVGATAAVAKLYQLEPEQIAHAIGLAGAQAGGARAVVGTDAKPFLCGYTAKTAVDLATAARAGVTGPMDVFESDYGFFSLLNDRYWDPAPLSTLGSTWRLAEPGLLFKRYPVCSAALALVEEAAGLRARHEFGIDDIREIRCSVPEMVAHSLIYDDPQTPQQAQFSLPFCVACALQYGDIRLDHLSPTVLFDHEIRSTMGKVQTQIDPELSTKEMRSQYPECARVEVLLEDSRTFESYSALATGMPGRPLSDEQLVAKFSACVRYADTEQGGEEQAAQQLMRSGSDASACSIRDVLDAFWANHTASAE